MLNICVKQNFNYTYEIIFQITDNLLKKLYFEIFKLTSTMKQEFQ